MNAIDPKFKLVSARTNPFAVERTDAIPFDFTPTPFDNSHSFFNHVQNHDFHGAIVGKHGRGKTTLLCELSLHLRDRQLDCELVFLPRQKQVAYQAIDDTIQRGNEGAIILIDGLERLPFLVRHRLISRSKSFQGFIATTHHRSRLRELIRCRTDQKTLITILDYLKLNQPDIREAGLSLYKKHKGNIRLVLRELYDLYADGMIGHGCDA